MDKHTAILAIPEIDDITINEARRLFLAYKEKGIISNSNFDDDRWTLNNETTGFHFNFQIDKNKFKQFGDDLKITCENFKTYLKTFIVCQMGELELGSLRSIIYCTKRIVYNRAEDLDAFLESNNGNWIGRITEFFSMIPAAGREKELLDWLTLFDDADERVRIGKDGSRRSLASFESYFRFDDIIKRFWSESQDDDEKLFFFPIWMWWNISGVLPLRPCEFVVTPRNCLSTINGKHTIAVRRNRIKGSGKVKSYKIDTDYDINRYAIPEKLAKEIEWYLDKTKGCTEADTHTLFVTETHYAKWERCTPYTSRYFSYINLRTCLRYFFELIIQERYGYKIIYEANNSGLSDEKSIEYLHLGDTRHIALINLIAEGATPVVAMMLAGHDNPEMSAHYYSNIAQLIECRTYRQFKKLIKGKQSYSLSRPTPKLPVKMSIPLDNGGRCFSEDVAKGNYTNCYKVMGPGGEVGFCKNCEYYKDDSNTFSDQKDLYVNKIENECRLLDEIVKKVRKEKGDIEDIIQVVLRLRDADYSYQQYLMEKWRKRKMARVKTYKIDEIIKLLNEYRFENSGAKVTIPKFGEYIRGKGYAIEDHTLRRDDEFRAYLNKVNEDDENRLLNGVVTYRTLDADAFLAKNNSRSKLKEALTTRDRYYANIAARAADAIKAKRASDKKAQELEARISELEALVSELNTKLEDIKAKNTSEELKKKNETIRKLKNVLDDYVYPDAANAILKKEGILEVANSLVPEDVIESKTVSANTDINEVPDKKLSKYDLVNSILGGFDE